MIPMSRVSERCGSPSSETGRLILTGSLNRELWTCTLRGETIRRLGKVLYSELIDLENLPWILHDPQYLRS
ncbi:MAG: hypothetical protein JWN70_2246 [Planctomycetaceae bacterium]|nr:hypothetical protein [Planctomycetaceae bacterium]